MSLSGWKGPQQFLVHIQQALNAIRQKGLQAALEKVIKDKQECTKMLTKANEVFGNYKGRDENPPKRKQLKKQLRLLHMRRRPSSPSLPRCSSCTPTYFWRKLDSPGARS